MGQQQLILLVLATVIVGLAIVVGIQAFTENSARANADAMMQDAVRIANDAQAWVQKPQPFGGPENGFDDFSTATFADLGYGLAADATEYENTNGSFELAASGDGLTITGESLADDGVTVRNQVVVAVCGTTSDDITGVVTTVGTQGTGATAPACGGGTAG